MSSSVTTTVHYDNMGKIVSSEKVSHDYADGASELSDFWHKTQSYSYIFESVARGLGWLAIAAFAFSNLH